MKRFPMEFCWGVSTSAPQIEGNIDERELSIWDYFATIPDKISDGHNLSVACDHCRHYQQDIDLMRHLGTKAYRFSIAWPRWMYPGGVSFYDRLVDALLSKDIQPWATLYHWDLPQVLENNGGWLNRDTARRFADYATDVARKLGDRVQHWMTINEPNVVCFQGYVAGVFAPGKKSWPAAFRVAHHLLLAHGLAMQAIRQSSHHPAKVGLVLKILPVETPHNTLRAFLGTQIWRTLGTRWFLDPVLRGSYPPAVAAIYRMMRLPVIEPGDLEIISPPGSPMDFLGVDYYFRQIIDARGRWLKHVPGAEHTAMGWEVCASALTRGLIHLKKGYGQLLPPIYITENGAAFDDSLIDSQVNDEPRIDYLGQHISAVRDAIDAGVDVRGYSVWSLLDNFEWSEGYTKRFGLVHVDFASPERTRTPKASFNWYRDVISNGGLSP